MTAMDSRPGEGEAPGRACRIANLACGRDGNGATSTLVPFRLTAACGWTTDVEQGVSYETNAGIARWAGHECLTAAAVAG
jgi:hypothetical protein